MMVTFRNGKKAQEKPQEIPAGIKKGPAAGIRRLARRAERLLTTVLPVF